MTILTLLGLPVFIAMYRRWSSRVWQEKENRAAHSGLEHVADTTQNWAASIGFLISVGHFEKLLKEP
jgi:hypothetical protein